MGVSATTVGLCYNRIGRRRDMDVGLFDCHFYVYYSQISSLGLVPKQRLQSFLRRVVVGSSHETISDIVNHVKLLRTFIHLLTKDDW